MAPGILQAISTNRIIVIASSRTFSACILITFIKDDVEMREDIMKKQADASFSLG
jgi:hypothetical protein